MQPKPGYKHPHPHRTPQPGVAGYKRSAHTNTDTPQHASQEWRGAAETRAQGRTPRPHTPATSGGVQVEHAHKHTHTPTPQPGVAGRSQNQRPTAHTHTPHPSQEWRGTGGARTQTHTHPTTPAWTGGAQPKPETNCTDPHRTPQPGVAGYKWSAHTITHTPHHPSMDWRGAAKTGDQLHRPTPHTPARSGGVQAERAHKHTHTPPPQHGLAGRSQNRRPTAQTHTAHPSQEWQGTSGVRTQSHTHPNTPARSGAAQPEPEPKHTHPHRTPQPGVAGYKRSAHTKTHTPQQASMDWRGAAETRADTHTPYPSTPTQDPSQDHFLSVYVFSFDPQKFIDGSTSSPGCSVINENPGLFKFWADLVEPWITIKSPKAAIWS